MKRYLQLLLFTAIAVTTQAQQFEIGLSGGAGFNTIPRFGYRETEILFRTAPTNSPVATIVGAFNFKKWQPGFAIEWREAAYQTSLNNNPGDRTFAAHSINYFYINNSSAIIPVKIFLDRKIIHGRFELTTGLSASYLFIANYNNEYFGSDAFRFSKAGSFGYAVGARAGATCFLSKHIGVSVALNADHANIHQLYSGPAHMQYYTVTTGIKYRF